MKLVEGQLIHRRYRLDSRLAQGGMGEVWKGYDIQLGRPVAIKALRALMARFVFSLVTTASIIWVSLLAVSALNAWDMTVGLVCEMTDKSAERTRSTSVGCIMERL